MKHMLLSTGPTWRLAIAALTVSLAGTLSMTATAHQHKAPCTPTSGTYSPDSNRPAQPPGRPTLVHPYQPVAGQYPGVSSPYGRIETHSDEGCYHAYYALDFQLNGQPFPVRAAAAGRLTYLTGVEAGNTVFIDHGKGWKTKYGHLPDNGVIVRGRTIQKGETNIPISAGEVFATSGSTGTSVNHLHFELRATYWPNYLSQRTWWNTWSYPPYELYGQSARVYEHISDAGRRENFVTEDPGLISNSIGNDTVSSLDVPRITAGGGDLGATQKVVSLYEHTYYMGRCEDFWNEDSDLRNNSIGSDTVSSIRIGVPCPSAATLAPSHLSMVASPTKVQLRWSAAVIPTGYAIFEFEKSLKAIVRGTTTSYTISGLQPGSNHCYYVYAFYKAGSSGIVWGCVTTPLS